MNKQQEPSNDDLERTLSLRQRVFRAEEALARANLAYVRAWLRYLSSENSRVPPSAAAGEAPALVPTGATRPTGARPEEGTTTSADLGWTEEPRSPSAAEYQAARRDKTVLVVDDEADIRFVLRALLEGAGYRVVEAGNGQEALDLVASHELADPASAPAVIILDMLMVPVDGWTFARLYRALPAPQGEEKAPILVLTAAHDAERRARDIGAEGFCGKPFRLEALLAEVDRLALAPPPPLALPTATEPLPEPLPESLPESLPEPLPEMGA